MRSSVVVVGRGAVGGVYLERLVECSDVELKVVADQERVDRYNKTPFLFNSKELKLNYSTPKVGDTQADFVIVATKWEGFADALSLIEPIVGEDTLILPLLNGIKPYEVAAQRFGAQKVLRGYYIGKTASRCGHSVSQSGEYVTVFGDDFNKSTEYSCRVKKIADIFEKSAIKYRIDEDMIYSHWAKLVVNIGLNQTSALDGGLNYGEIITNEKWYKLCVDLMNEAVEVANCCEVRNAQRMVETALELLPKLAKEDYSSMAQDVKAGRVTEWDIFGGYLIEKAEIYGVDTPKHIWLRDRLQEQRVIV